MEKIKNFPIVTKFILAFSTLLLITVISAALIFFQNSKVAQGIEKNELAINALNLLSTFSNDLLESREAILSLINSGEISYITEHEDRNKDLNSSYALLLPAVSISSSEQQASQIKTVYSYFKDWKSKIADKQIHYMKFPDSVDLARLIEASVENKSLWQKIKLNLEELTSFYQEKQINTGADQKQHVNSLNYAVLIASALSALLSILLALFLARIVAMPIRELTAVTAQLKDKNWDTYIAFKDRTDEIGQMSKALEIFRENGKRADLLEKQQSESMQRQLDRAKTVQESIKLFRKNCNALFEGFTDASENLLASADTLEKTSFESHDYTKNVTASVDNTNMNVQVTASAVEEMSASIGNISTQIQEISSHIQTTAGFSQDAVIKVRNLQEASEEINAVTDLINQIAGQINLLALNATIESARAGDAGKGFAVVASEVKNLATQTSNATDQVRGVIEKVSHEIKSVVETIQSISNSVEQVDTSSTIAADAVKEQSAAVNEISQSVSKVSQETNIVSQNVKAVEEKVSGTKEVATNVNKLSKTLQDSSNKLNKSIDTFIAEVAEG